jgi:penicillin-binding protein 1A
MIANGGKLVIPTFFDHVQDRRGKTVLSNTFTACDGCKPIASPERLPTLKDVRPQVTDPVVCYQMISLLTGVVERGTGKSLQALKSPIAVKSGTTNEFRDAWMVGFSNNLVVGVFVGFDTPRTLGHKHFGAVVAGPIFMDFMQQAIQKRSASLFQIPRGVKLVRVNADTGKKTSPDDPQAIWEAFRHEENTALSGTEDVQPIPAPDDTDNIYNPDTPIEQWKTVPQEEEAPAGSGGVY